jgi:hypothetical protein
MVALHQQDGTRLEKNKATCDTCFEDSKVRLQVGLRKGNYNRRWQTLRDVIPQPKEKKQ